MQSMIEFSMYMLQLLTDFLMSEPIFYMYGMFLFMFVVKIFLMIVRGSK